VGRYYGFKRPLEARKVGDTWWVVFDVGILKVERVELRIDAGSGSIVEYKAPGEPMTDNPVAAVQRCNHYYNDHTT
jgi:hypothetical protein